MSDPFREVDEEIRHEMYKKLWAQYGHFVIVAAIVIAGGTLAYQGWQSYSKAQKESRSDQFIAAVELLDSGATLEQASAAFQSVARESSSGYRLLAKFHEAALLTDSGKASEAVAVYDQISVDGAAMSIFQDLARIRAAQALIDSASLSDVKARVASILNDTNPWRFSARETVALVAYREGNIEEARNGFESLVLDIQTPPSIKERANEMIAVIGFPDVLEGAATPDILQALEEALQTQSDEKSDE